MNIGLLVDLHLEAAAAACRIWRVQPKARHRRILGLPSSQAWQRLRSPSNPRYASCPDAASSTKSDSAALAVCAVIMCMFVGIPHNASTIQLLEVAAHLAAAYWIGPNSRRPAMPSSGQGTEERRRFPRRHPAPSVPADRKRKKKKKNKTKVNIKKERETAEYYGKTQSSAPRLTGGCLLRLTV